LYDWSGKKDGFLLLFDRPFLEDIAQSSLFSVHLPVIKVPTAIHEKKITYIFGSEGL
jgi:hypothetical protein